MYWEHLSPNQSRPILIRLVPLGSATVPNCKCPPVEVKKLQRQFFLVSRVIGLLRIAEEASISVSSRDSKSTLEEAVHIARSLILRLLAVDEGECYEPSPVRQLGWTTDHMEDENGFTVHRNDWLLQRDVAVPD